MTKKDKLKEEFIMNFGHAYQAFGLSKLMGHVVALLIHETKPISLEEITKQLHRSKGPISQITRRLRDKHLIRRVWQPTSRKDFYEIEPEDGEEIPIILDNKPVFKPFELVINLYGVPRYFEIDPTPFVSLFFALFFG